MKKISAFLLTIAACFAFAGCGKSNKKNTTKRTTTSSQTQPQEKTLTTANYAAVSQALGNKYLFDATIPFKDTHSGQVTNYNVSLAVDKSGDTHKIAMVSDMGGTYFKQKSSTEYIAYDYNEVQHSYNNASIYPKTETDEMLAEDIKISLKIACGLTIKYTSVEDATLFNRPCKHYLNSYTKDNAIVTEEWIIDNGTGICLGHTKATSAGFITDETTFTVSDFSLAAGVDSCFLTQESRIGVKFWDTEYFKGHGLKDTGSYYVDIEDIISHYTGTMPTISQNGASTAYVDGNKAGNKTSYILEGDNDVKDNFVEYLVDNLYNCGAKYDVIGLDRDKSLLIDDYNFNAYSNQTAQYNVNITYIPGTEAKLTVTLSDDSYIPQNQNRVYRQLGTTYILGLIDNGYKIDVTLPEEIGHTGEFTTYEASLAYWDGSIYMSSDDGTNYFKKIDNETTPYHYYYILSTETSYGDAGLVDQSFVDTQINIIQQLQIACANVINYKTKETVNYLGRQCMKLSTIIPGDGTTEVYVIDILTGICLEHSISAGGQPIIGESFKVTGFALNTSATEGPVKDFFTAENAKLPGA